jgi:hypothetical protein
LCRPNTASTGKALEQPVGDHGLGAAAAFFGGLEDQHRGAVEVAPRGQVARRGQQHGGVAVMAAGVHQAGVAAGMGKAVGFVHRQRVHVGAQADGAAAGPAVAPVHDAHHAGAPQAAVQRDAPSGQLRGHQVRRALFLEAQLGVGVDVAPQRGKLVGTADDVGVQPRGRGFRHARVPAPVPGRR